MCTVIYVCACVCIYMCVCTCACVCECVSVGVMLVCVHEYVHLPAWCVVQYVCVYCYSLHLNTMTSSHYCVHTQSMCLPNGDHVVHLPSNSADQSTCPFAMAIVVMFVNVVEEIWVMHQLLYTIQSIASDGRMFQSSCFVSGYKYFSYNVCTICKSFLFYLYFPWSCNSNRVTCSSQKISVQAHEGPVFVIYNILYEEALLFYSGVMVILYRTLLVSFTTRDM